MSEYKGLITAGTLLACFAILSMTIPVVLYAAEDRIILDPPEFFRIEDLYYYGDSVIHYLNTTGGRSYPFDTRYYVKDVDIGEWDVDMRYLLPNETGPAVYNIFLIHIHTEWLIIPSDHLLEWRSEIGVDRGVSLEITEIHSDMEGESRIDYYADCDHTTYRCQVAFNETTYTNASDAWDHGNLGIFFGVNFEDSNTGFNAMNLIASILFFQMPEVHWTINLLLAIPMWIAIGYISLILILRAIDALPFT